MGDGRGWGEEREGVRVVTQKRKRWEERESKASLGIRPLKDEFDEDRGYNELQIYYSKDTTAN